MAMPYRAAVSVLLQTAKERIASLGVMSTSQALALFRILVTTIVLGAADVWRAPLLVAPGLGDVTQALRVVVLASALATLLGAATRPASIVLAASLTALLGLIQAQGTP